MNNTNKNIRVKKSKQALVSIVIPVYNAGSYLKLCLDSLVNQTYKNIEIIAVDDCSTDHSYKILKDFARKYPFIKVFRNSVNKGVSQTAKKAIKNASGDYIARMDADDIALPNRIELQVKHLRENRKTVAVGGQCLVIDSKNNIVGKKAFPTSFNEIYKYIFQFVPVQQPTLMIARKRLPEDFVYYVDGMNTAEEIELFFKLFQYGKVENLSQVVLLYRIHEGNTSMQNVKETFLLTLIARLRAIFKYSYHPTAQGIIITFMQTVLVLILPKNLVIGIYKVLRDASIEKRPSLIRYNTASVKTLLGSI